MRPLGGLIAFGCAVVGLVFFLARPAVEREPAPVEGDRAAAEATTVLLVRHAETVDDGTRDPALSQTGRARAEALADGIDGAGLDAVYATPLRRTRETAEIAGGRHELPLAIVALDGGVEAHVQEQVERLRNGHAGGVVLVVGHSNTVPAIARALTGRDVEPIAEDEYDRLLVVTIRPDSSARLIEARYGPAVPYSDSR